MSRAPPPLFGNDDGSWVYLDSQQLMPADTREVTANNSTRWMIYSFNEMRGRLRMTYRQFGSNRPPGQKATKSPAFLPESSVRSWAVSLFIPGHPSSWCGVWPRMGVSLGTPSHNATRRCGRHRRQQLVSRLRVCTGKCPQSGNMAGIRCDRK